jgi:putative CocE/NonD family hydrolase
VAALVDIRVERNVAVPMRDGTMTRADVFRPEPEGRYPVLLCRTPYDKSAANISYGWLQPIRPASEGYVVVIQDVRGRFQSEGTFRPFHQELADGFDTVEWCARQPWSNGRVGMYGLSYLGATQWLAAAAQPPNLQAIFPGLTGSDFFDGWTYQGGAFLLSFNLVWTAVFLAIPEVARYGLSEAGARDALAGLYGVAFDSWPALRHLPLAEVPAFANEVVAPYFREWLAHPARDAYWDAVSIENDHPRIHAPAFNLGGWFDLFIRGTLRNFRGMRADGPTEIARGGQKLMVGPWAHSTQLGATAGHSIFGSAAQVLVEDLQMRWFDHWLRDARLERVRRLAPARGPRADALPARQRGGPHPARRRGALRRAALRRGAARLLRLRPREPLPNPRRPALSSSRRRTAGPVRPGPNRGPPRCPLLYLRAAEQPPRSQRACRSAALGGQLGP